MNNYNYTTDEILHKTQKCELEIMKDLHNFLVTNNLKYSLCYGTALGAVRHKGFIPWDDDIDTEMLREDYEKLADIFNEATNDKDLYIETYRNSCKNRQCMFFYKIKHRKLPFLFVDIFPVEKFHSKLDIDEKSLLNKKILEVKNRLNSSNETIGLSDVELKEKLKEVMANEIF